MSSAFDAFLKKKKGSKSAKKPKAKVPPVPEPDPAVEEVVEEEASEEDEEEVVEEVPEVQAKTVETPKPPKPAAPPKPAPKQKASAQSAPAPAAPMPPSESYTASELQAAVQISDFGQSFEESDYGEKQSITVVGDKGGGKTTLALAFCGKKEKMLVISYDRMAIRNKYKMRYPDNIKVIDPMTLYDASSPIKKRDSMVKIFDYLVGVEEYVNGPRHGGLLVEHESVDWVVHDGTDILMEICEMVMRSRHELLPAQGVEWNLWKDRKDAIQDVYHKSLSLAKKGVIYTTYFTEKQLDEDITGQKKTKEMPKWMDIILHQTLHTFAVSAQAENFFLFVHQSKSVKKDVTKKTYDITGASFEEKGKKKGEILYKMDFSKLYEVVEEIVREVF